jgi:hypothetical protein
MSMTRKEHLDWAKHRALEYVVAGDLQGAFQSMASDLSKHAETRSSLPAMNLGMDLLLGGHLDGSQKMREWIEGFN